MNARHLVLLASAVVAVTTGCGASPAHHAASSVAATSTPTVTAAPASPAPVMSTTPTVTPSVIVKTVIKTVAPKPTPTPTRTHHTARTLVTVSDQDYPVTTGLFHTAGPWKVTYGWSVGSVRSYPPVQSGCSIQIRPITAAGNGVGSLSQISDSGPYGRSTMTYSSTGAYQLRIGFSCHYDPSDGYPDGALHGEYSVSVVG